MSKIAYFGPAGTFTEQAAGVFDPSAQLVPYPTIRATAEAVIANECSQAVLPIENSLQGSVTDTLDVLIHLEGIQICSEIAIAIVHNLMVRPDNESASIKQIYSHPQALAQCRGYIETHYSGVEIAASLSTAAAVEMVMNSVEPLAAIAPERSARLYGAQIIAEGIQDSENNVTRFVVVAKQDNPRTGRDKTSLCFTFSEDKPGQLMNVMAEFSERNLNLNKIESRPTRLGLGQYYFLIDFDGHREDEEVKTALAVIGSHCSQLKIFGSYERMNINDASSFA